MIQQWLRSPTVIVLGTVLGGVLGATAPAAGLVLKPFAELYIAALSISIMPIVMTALIGGTGQMLRQPSLRRAFPRFALVYLAMLVVPCAAALVVGILLEPGSQLSAEAAASLGRSLSPAEKIEEATGVADFIATVIPSNIFRDLYAGNFAAIVVFCIVLGIALGVVEAPAADETLRIVQTFYEAFSRMFLWVLAPLAIGLFCLTAGITATISAEVLWHFVDFIVAFYCAGIAVFIVYTMILLALCGVGASLFGLRQPLTISFFTNNPIIALHPAINALVDHFKVDGDVAKAVAPFGIIASQHGQIINIVLLTIFLANIYGIDLSPPQVAILALGGTISGTALVGGGATLAPAMAPILDSVGVPGHLAVVVLATTEPIIGPLISLLTVYAASTLVLLGRGPAERRRTSASPPRAESEP